MSFIKNFTNRFDKKSFLGSFKDTLPASTGSWGNDDFLNASKTSLYLNKALRKRAEKVGGIQFELYRNGNLVEQHDILNVLSKPNDIHNAQEFWALFQIYKDIYGAGYILIDSKRELFEQNAKIDKLWILPSHRVKPVIEGGKITKFEYNKGNGGITIYPAENIIYSYRPDPANPLMGESLLVSGARAISTDIDIADYQSRVMKNGGKVEGIFQFKSKSKLDKKQRAELERDYEREYAGAKKAGRPMFLAGETEYTRLGLTPSELDYLQTKNMTLNDILILTGVPKTILGAFDDIKFDNADASERIFLRETIKPLMDSIASALNETVVPEQYELVAVDPTPEDRNFKLKTLEVGDKVSALTLNEKRAILGYDAIEGGDEKPEPKTQPNRQTEDGEVKKKTNEWEHPFRDPEYRRTYEKVYIKRFDKRVKKFKEAIEGYYEGQKERIVEKIDPAGLKKYTKGLADEVFDKTLEIAIAKDTVLPLLQEVMAEAGKEAMDAIDYAFEFVPTVDVKATMDKRADLFAEKINETTFGKLQETISDGVSGGLSRAELADNVQDLYGDISAAKALTIANTEIQIATQTGNYNAYKQAGIKTKIWLTVGDGNVRLSHQSLDGEEVPMDQNFTNGLKYPGDPSGSGGEVINCRCTI